jgi:hypothetical protein
MPSKEVSAAGIVQSFQPLSPFLGSSPQWIHDSNAMKEKGKDLYEYEVE